MKRRHILAVLALSYLTLGIYTIYWLYRTRLDLLQHLPDKNAIPRVIIMFIPWLAVIGSLIVAFILSAILRQNDPDSVAAGVVAILSVIIMIAGFIAILIVSFWWFYRYFQALEQAVQGNDAMLHYTLWVVFTLFGIGPVWVVLAQSDLNKFIDNSYQPLRVPMQPNYHPQTHHQTAEQQPATHGHVTHTHPHEHHPAQPHHPTDHHQA